MQVKVLRYFIFFLKNVFSNYFCKSKGNLLSTVFNLIFTI
jgi:hypothetical protein